MKFYILCVSFGGVVGMFFVMGLKGEDVCVVFVVGLGLGDFGVSWYVECNGVVELVVWMI